MEKDRYHLLVAFKCSSTFNLVSGITRANYPQSNIANLRHVRPQAIVDIELDAPLRISNEELS